LSRADREKLLQQASVAGGHLFLSEWIFSMTKTTPEQNKAPVLKAFDTLFNKRDYTVAAAFWSDTYIQHSKRSEDDGCHPSSSLQYCQNIRTARTHCGGSICGG
jgi:hypothetical protein